MYRTTYIFVVIFGRITWSPTLTDNRRLPLFEDRVLLKIAGLKRDEVTGDWGRLHSEVLWLVILANSFSRDKTKKSKMGATCGIYGVRTDADRAKTKYEYKTYV
jgi:hypothetical protein